MTGGGAPGGSLPRPRRSEVAGNSVERAATYLRRLIFARALPAGTRVPQAEYEHDPAIAPMVKTTAETITAAIIAGDAAAAERAVETTHHVILERVTPLLRNDGLMRD